MTAFVLCSRLTSSRVPSKPLIKYNGQTHLELLIKRLLKTGIPVFLAVPEKEVVHYSFLLDIFPKGLKIFIGDEDDPLYRTYACAYANGITNIIRVTHDKIFVNTFAVPVLLNEFINRKLDYIYSSDFTPGTGFEIMSFSALEKASVAFKRVEHISYAVKAISENRANFRFKDGPSDVRLLVDYKEDVQLMNVIFASLGTDCELKDVYKFLSDNPTLKNINKLPVVTVYTCALNAAKWIEEAMSSVAQQIGFSDFEYLLIDDFSEDATLFHMAKFSQVHKNARFIRNEANYGLASSSNIALKNAKGKYIIRLDADDFFVSKTVITSMLQEIEDQKVDILYPNCYAGLSQKRIQKGNEHNHAGGALFRTSAINHIKFTDSLRNYEGLDLFYRAREQLKIGYYNKVTFCYRQHNASMSKNNLNDRVKQRKILETKYEKYK